MITKLRFYDQKEVIKLDTDKLRFTAFGVYMLGFNLDRFEWALATVKDAAVLLPHLGVLRQYEQVGSFEQIGSEARYYHDILSSYIGQPIPANIWDNLRDARTRWATIATERLQDLYLVTPKTTIDPKHLMQGIISFLEEKHFVILEQIEIIDLNESCLCILIGSATAAEHIALRAAESLLRRWYEYKTKKKLKYKTWGTVLDKLAEEYPEKNRPKEINLLGYLKQRRDEVAHPERVSSPREAEATLMNVCTLIAGIEPVLTKLAVPKNGQQFQIPPPPPEIQDMENV